MTSSSHLTDGTYLRLDDLLSCQRPLTDGHDEMLFVIIHQVYELWFKQTLYETDLLQRRLEGGDGAGAVATAPDRQDPPPGVRLPAPLPGRGRPPVPADVRDRDPREPWPGDDRVRAVLAQAYAGAGTPAEVCESLIDVDEGIQEWRYRHVKAVERIIGSQLGTGGSTGVEYLRGNLFRPFFPGLWQVRSRP